MRASSSPLDGYKVKLTVEVGEDELLADREQTIGRLTSEARLPGFRPGKVPRRVLEARLGSRAIREQVLAEALPKYYEEAVGEQDLDVIAQPEIEITSGEEAGPVIFDAVVQVRPQVAIPGYEGLQVTVSDPDPSDEDVDAQLDRLREQFAQLADVDRAAASGDVLTIDVHASRAGKRLPELDLEDQTYELGSGGLVGDADERLTGTKVGEIVTLALGPDDEPDLEVRVIVKRVREKILPAADDAFASDASEFDTLEELRGELRTRIASTRRVQARAELREKALEALAALVSVDPPEVLVRHDQQHLLANLLTQLERQRMRFADYLRATGRDEESLLAELEKQATLQVKVDLALRALAAAEGIEADESDLDEEIVRLSANAGANPAEVRAQLEREGRIAGLRSDMRNSKALSWLVEHVSVVDGEGNPMDRSALLLDEGTAESGEDHDPRAGRPTTGTAAAPDGAADPTRDAASGGGLPGESIGVTAASAAAATTPAAEELTS